jgi:hypothetical protein
LDSQGGGQMKDLARIQRGNNVRKILNFVLWNTLALPIT